MTTLNLDESHDFNSERYLLATEIADLMTKQFNSKELSDIFPYFQTGGTIWGRNAQQSKEIRDSNISNSKLIQKS